MLLSSLDRSKAIIEMFVPIIEHDHNQRAKYVVPARVFAHNAGNNIGYENDSPEDCDKQTHRAPPQQMHW